MRDYYTEVSFGKVDVIGSVDGWLRMPQTYDFYTNSKSGMGNYPRNCQRLVEDAVKVALDAGIDFPDNLDNFNEGVVTAFFIVHAGIGAEGIRDKVLRNNEIWSHKWGTLKRPKVGTNMTVGTYLTVPHDCNMGVCAHELGHLVMELDDFYDPNYGKDGMAWDGAGKWDLMAGGSHNNFGRTPAHLAGLHKMQHSWVDITVIDKTTKQVVVKQNTDDGGMVVKVVSSQFGKNQFLVIENRMKAGFDFHLPGEGVLLWKVDTDKQQTNPYRPALYLIQADGKHDLDRVEQFAYNAGDAGDPFPGSEGITSVKSTGNISTSFPGMDSGITIENIKVQSGRLITLDIIIA